MVIFEADFNVSIIKHIQKERNIRKLQSKDRTISMIIKEIEEVYHRKEVYQKTLKKISRLRNRWTEFIANQWNVQICRRSPLIVYTRWKPPRMGWVSIN